MEETEEGGGREEVEGGKATPGGVRWPGDGAAAGFEGGGGGGGG